MIIIDQSLFMEFRLPLFDSLTFNLIPLSTSSDSVFFSPESSLKHLLTSIPKLLRMCSSLFFRRIGLEFVLLILEYFSMNGDFRA